MFSGIISHIGKILKIYKEKNNCIIEIESKMRFKKNKFPRKFVAGIYKKVTI